MTSESQTTHDHRSLLRTAQVCFFLSGLSALIYEVVWLEKIQLLMGHTVYGLAATLAAYLSGLGLGSLYAPILIRRLARRSPVSLYVLAEVGIALYALIFPWVFKAVTLPYEAFARAFPNVGLEALALIQFLVAATALVPPTFLMGTTLPILTHSLFSRKHETSRQLSRLYAINTLGAAVGSALSAYVLIPSLGFGQTLSAAFACNLLLALIAWARMPEAFRSLTISRLWGDWLRTGRALRRLNVNRAGTTQAREGSRWLPERGDGPALAMLLVSGFATLTVQLVWNRLASLSFGPSITIFALVTTVLLLGLGIGAGLAHRWIQRGERAVDLGFTLSPFIGATVLVLGSALLTHAPDFVLEWHLDWKPSFATYSLLSALTLFFTVGVASIGLGLLFPFAFSVLTQNTEGKRSLEKTSRGYAVNILGLLLGSFLGSFVILPQSSLEGLLHFTAYALIGTGVLAAGFRSTQPGFAVLAAATSAALIVSFSSPWDLQRMTAGYFYNRAKEIPADAIKDAGYTSRKEFAAAGSPKLIDYKDDVHATISIHEYPSQNPQSPPVRLFKINGKVDGNTRSDLVTTRTVSLAPILVRDDFQKALVIGLGTGSTAALTLQYPQLERLDVVELSAALAGFSKKYFRGTDGDLFADSRTHLIVRDGREFLQHSSETYDLIISEPSNPWVAGVASLFTREAFQEVASRLDPNRGLAALWFHAYNLDCPAVNSVLKAAAEVFPSMALLKNGNDYFILGALTPTLPYRALSKEGYALLSKYSETFSHVANKGPTPQELQTQIYLGTWVSSAAGLRTRIDALPPSITVSNTDETPVLQYRSGQTFFTQTHCQVPRDSAWSHGLENELKLVKDSYQFPEPSRSLAGEKARASKLPSAAIRTF